MLWGSGGEGELRGVKWKLCFPVWKVREVFHFVRLWICCMWLCDKKIQVLYDGLGSTASYCIVTMTPRLAEQLCSKE